MGRNTKLLIAGAVILYFWHKAKSAPSPAAPVSTPAAVPAAAQGLVGRGRRKRRPRPQGNNDGGDQADDQGDG